MRIHHTFELQLHRAKNFQLCTDSQFVEKVRDIVGLHLNAPERAVVLCVDKRAKYMH